ncbi:MAG TPA: hypothetical protein VGJ39_05350 [Vicinamibacterales bacterium]
MRIRRVFGLTALATVVIASASCGDIVRSSRSPMLLIVNSIRPEGLVIARTLQSDVLTATGILPDLARTTLSVVMKDVTIVAPSSNNQVRITGYHVTYRRGDGQNREGIDVPYGFDGAFTLSVIAGNVGTADFEIVRAIAKAESPLVQLRDGSNLISTIADVTFFGQDAVGNELSTSASVLIDFGNFEGT